MSIDRNRSNCKKIIDFYLKKWIILDIKSNIIFYLNNYV